MKHEFLKTVMKNIRMIHNLCPSYLPLAIMKTILHTILPFIGIYLSARILDQMVNKESFGNIFLTVIWMAGLTFLLYICINILSYTVGIKRGIIFDNKNTELSQKAIRMDYDILERKSTMEKMSKAEEASDAMGGLPQYLDTVLSLLGNMVSLMTAVLSLLGLLGTAIIYDHGSLTYFMSSPFSTVLLLAFIGISVVVNSKCERKTGELNYEASIQNNEFMRIYWFFFNLIFDQPMGKDIRLFHMQPLIKEKQRVSQEQMEEITKRTLRKTVGIEAFSTAFYQLFLLMAYFFVGIKTVLGIITLGDLTKYIGVILLLQSQVAGIFSTLTKLRNHNIYLKNFTNYMEIPNEKYEGTLPVEKRLDSEYELEFRNVSFHYPNHDAIIIKNLSFRLQIGQKLAIVGPNGAGKTTFIKLLSRLYDPTEGEILLNGINIKKYDYEEYQALFSVVFQDFQIFAFPVAENVAACADYDEDKVWKSLKDAGIKDKIQKFPKGLLTKLMKDQQEDGEEGVEISGGEKQKIALARALYHDAPIVILDEPTSALDPLAEQDIYERFQKMVKQKTAVFISHRMSSCRFCDQVLVLNDGEIVQSGTHEALVKEEGLYAQMWNAQAQYYT